MSFPISTKDPIQQQRVATMASSSRQATVGDKVGSLLFCPACGSLLDVPSDEDVIKCEPCGHVQDASRESSPPVSLLLSLSSPLCPYPSALRVK